MGACEGITLVAPLPTLMALSRDAKSGWVGTRVGGCSMVKGQRVGVQHGYSSRVPNGHMAVYLEGGDLPVPVVEGCPSGALRIILSTQLPIPRGAIREAYTSLFTLSSVTPSRGVLCHPPAEGPKMPPPSKSGSALLPWCLLERGFGWGLIR